MIAVRARRIIPPGCGPERGVGVVMVERQEDAMLRCKGGHVVGVRLADGTVEIRHGGRIVRGDIRSIQCAPPCRKWWRADDDSE